ncbi:MAG: isoprenyl transferase [Terriglobales bacterium]
MSLAVKSETAEAELLRRVDPAHLPRHIAVIMDGSGRWAERHHRPRVAGHLAGVQAVRATVEGCARLHIPALTLYAFSAENWKRPEAEVRFLMRLLRRYLRSETANLHRQNIRLEAIGRLAELSPEVRADLEAARAATSANTGMVLTLALNYGARDELVDACQALVDEARAQGRLESLRVSEADLAAHLYTAGLPEPDLLIRTSGELRVSNFLLWQIAYAEIWVTPVLWPDFTRLHLLQAVVDFQSRERRFGGLAPARARRRGATAE